MLIAVPLDKLLQVLAGFRNVLPQGRYAYFGVFRPAGIEQFSVRLAGTVQVTGEHQVESGVAITIDI